MYNPEGLYHPANIAVCIRANSTAFIFHLLVVCFDIHFYDLLASQAYCIKLGIDCIVMQFAIWIILSAYQLT